MSFFSFYTNPKFAVTRRAMEGLVVCTLALSILITGIRFVFAQQNNPPSENNDSGPSQDGPPPGSESDGRGQPPPSFGPGDQEQRPPPGSGPDNQQPPPPFQNGEDRQRGMNPPPEQPNKQNGQPPFQGQAPGYNQPGNQQGGQPGNQPGSGDGSFGKRGGGGEQDQARMEARQKAQNEQNFKQVVQQVKQMSSMLKRLTTRIATMKKSGITIPQDLLTNIDKATQDIMLILNAKSIEDDGVQDALSDLQDVGSAIQEGIPALEQLSQASAMIKQADSQIKKLDASLTRTLKLVKTSKIEISSQIDAFTQAVSDIKAAAQKAKDAIASSDGEAAIQILQDDVFAKLQDAFQYEMTVRTVQNIRSNIKRFSSFITNTQKTIVKMQKANTDIGDAVAQLDQMQIDLNQLKEEVTQKDVDPSTLIDLVDTLLDAQNSIQETLGQPSGAPMFGVNPNEAKDFQSFQGFSAPLFGGPSMGGGQPSQPIPSMPGNKNR